MCLIVKIPWAVYHPSLDCVSPFEKASAVPNLEARVIAAIENPKGIIVQSARPYGQGAVLKFAQYIGAHAIAGRHTPGTFTNQLQTSFSKPRLLILTDPRTDHQPIKEAALGNIPTIAFCDTDSPMRCVALLLRDHAAAAIACDSAAVFAWKGEILQEYWWCTKRVFDWSPGGGYGELRRQNRS